MQGDTPSRTEIERQLQRLLKSDALAAAPRLSALLERIVRDSLIGARHEEYEYLLGIEIFKRARDWSTLTDNIVRQNMVNLRAALRNHYQTRGTGDLVTIEIPRRQGFKARFSYNAHAPIAERCAIIAERFYRLSPCVPPAEARHFIRELRKSAEHDPLYAPVHAHLAEILLTCAMCGPPLDMTSAACVAEAESAMEKCRSIRSDFWLAQIVSGALACCRFKWKDAAQAFDKAGKVALAETRGNFWYVAYLAATGNFAEAAECVKARSSVSDPLLDPASHLMAAALYYLRGDYASARACLALNLVKRVSPLRSYARLLDGQDITEAIDLANWLAEALMACVALEEGKNRMAVLYAEAALEHGAPAGFEGLVYLARCRKQAPDSLSGIPAAGEHFAQHGPLGAALASLGLDEHARAIGYLKKACGEGHPLMAWLHLLPVFSPLKRFKKFTELLAKVAPPG